MSRKPDTITLSKDEYKARKSMELAAQRGMVSLVSADPRIGSQFKINTPWIAGTSRKPAADLPDIVKGKSTAKIGDWYQRGTPEEAVYKFRPGACENCGAMTHKKKDCLERPRKVGAKYSGQDFKGDEDIRHLDFDYEAKNDRWNGYNPDSYMDVIQEHQLVNEKVEERNREKGTDVDEEFKERLMNRMYLDPNVDPRTRSSFGLRQKGDKAKYLENLEDDAPFYDGKTRAMMGNPNPHVDPELQEFKGDDYLRYTGDTLDFLSQDKFAWDHVKKYGSELNSVAMPTLTEMLHKKAQAKNNMLKGKMFEEISKQYGGTQHFADRMEELLISKDQYVEYDQLGNVVNNNQLQKQGKSKYPEDVYPQDHTSVWGSWWNKELGWGFACCHGTDRNAICLGDKGKTMAIIKEYRVVKKREADLRFAENSENNTNEMQDIGKRIDEIEKIIDERKIHINLESHKAYEKHLAEQNQKKFEDEKNQKFQQSIKFTEQAPKIDKERSRSREKTQLKRKDS